MRPVKGLDKPLVQWFLLAACAVMTILLVLAARSVARATRQVDDLVAGQTTAAVDRQSLEEQLTRERATREALALEIARLRARQGPETSSGSEIPTLTLAPTASLGVGPPEPTVAEPGRAQLIELRLLMPETVGDNVKTCQIIARDWSTGQPRWSRADVPVADIDGRRAAVAYVTGEMFAPGAYELLVTPTASDTGASEPTVSFEVGVRQGGSQ